MKDVEKITAAQTVSPQVPDRLMNLPATPFKELLSHAEMAGTEFWITLFTPLGNL